MSSIVLAMGLNTLIKAGQSSCLCCIERAGYQSARVCKQGLRITHLSSISKKWKSSTAFLKTSGLPDGDYLRTDGEKEASSRNIRPKFSNNVKILLTEESKKVKALVSQEAPLLHHAQAGAVVDIQRCNPPPNSSSAAHVSSLQEILLPVDQLLKDSHKSVKRTKFLVPYEDDLEYVERVGQNHEKPKLVGALTPDALDWRPQHLEISKLGSYYASLSKSRLTGLVVITTVAGYAMAPAALDPTTLILCSLGTGLVSSAANTINQVFEIPYDSQMDRTKNRLLVRGLVSPLHAVCFATVCSTTGIGMLYFGANGLAASLGALNLLLYISVYTPMKRLTILNTWVGSVVGAIPPLIGWASCTGELGAGAWIMAGILYAWQFPHFNSLSWNLRPDYSRAGYRMMSVTNPGLCRRVALRYSIAMIGLCTLAPLINVTTWTFAVDSLPLNAYLSYLAWKFYQDADSKSSRKLFMFTLIHLPAIMMLMIISKKHDLKKKDDNTASNSSEEKCAVGDKLSSGTTS